MSADDDTFDIDIYGDDTQEEQPPPEPVHEQQEVVTDNIDDIEYDDNTAPRNEPEPTTAPPPKVETSQDPTVKQEPSQSATPQQGTKRKATDSPDYDSNHPYVDGWALQLDARSTDPGATSALKFADLHWWTTEEDLRAYASAAGVESELRDVAFGEHKINGKSRGEAYLEFSSAHAATVTKREVERGSQQDGAAGVKKTPFSVAFTGVGNPFRTGPSVGGKKEFAGAQQGGGGGGPRGGYNNNFNHRGNFGGGRGNFQNRGGGFNNNNQGMYNNNRPQHQQQQQWGMNGGWQNPMMNNMGMGNMGGFGGMNRGGMMGNMMGRGGFGGMNMPNMGMNMGMGGMNRGGGNMMNMMGRGGWGNSAGNFQGGMQQPFNGAGGGGGFQGGGGMSPQQQQQGNKRPKME